MEDNKKNSDWNTFELDETALIAFTDEDAMILSTGGQNNSEQKDYTSVMSIIKDMDEYEKTSEHDMKAIREQLTHEQEVVEPEGTAVPKLKRKRRARGVFRGLINKIKRRK